MRSVLDRINVNTINPIYVIAILVSVLLSWDGAVRGSILNPDGICYLQSAAMYGTASFSSAMHLCGQAQWPFYSYLIFLFSSLSKLSISTAAFFLNGIFSVISVVMFIYIAKLLGGNRRVLWFAALVILLAHEFNSVREYIIRDHGFWAFYLISFAALIHFFRSDKFIFAVMWSFSLIVATLFRIEGAIFLLFVPFVALLQIDKSFFNNLKQFFKLNFILISLLLAAVLYINFGHHNISLNRVAEVQYQLTHGLQTVISDFNARADALGKNVLSVYSARDAGIVLFILLVVWFLLNVITNVSTIYAVLFGVAFIKRPLTNDSAAKLCVYSYLIINLLICAIFLTELMFLSKRYLIALSLILMMWVPFGLDYLWQQKQKLLFSVAIFFILLSSLGGIIEFGYSKQYLADAGQWLNLNASPSANIYSNDYQVMYYSKHFGNKIFETQQAWFNNPMQLTHGKWRQYDYLALRIDKKDPKVIPGMQEISIKPSVSFSNKRGDKVIIYKISHEENIS